MVSEKFMVYEINQSYLTEEFSLTSDITKARKFSGFKEADTIKKQVAEKYGNEYVIRSIKATDQLKSL
jgi:hypothetical protein